MNNKWTQPKVGPKLNYCDGANGKEHSCIVHKTGAYAFDRTGSILWDAVSLDIDTNACWIKANQATPGYGHVMRGVISKILHIGGPK